jgi:hypothetical protein
MYFFKRYNTHTNAHISFCQLIQRIIYRQQFSFIIQLNLDLRLKISFRNT